MPDKGSPVAVEQGQGEGRVPKKSVHRVEVGVRECSIHSVVVYQDRAEVKRVVPARLAPGDNQVVVTGLASCINKDSVRVEGQGLGEQVIITDVIYSSSTTQEERLSGSKEEHQQLLAEIAEKEAEQKRLVLKREVLSKEKELLSKFANHICKVHSLEGEGESLAGLVARGSVGGVMAFMQRFEAKAASLDGRLLEVGNDLKKLEEKIHVLRANADKVNPNKKEVTTDTVRSLCVGLECGGEVDVRLVLSYVVSNASWSSAYDVRVFAKNKAMKVQYYGLIQQSTGEDWENASISLSTAQPSIGGSAPALPTKIIRFVRPRPIRVRQLQREVDRVKYAMRDNIDKQMQRGEALEALEDRAEYLNQNADMFQRTATRLKKKAFLPSFSVRGPSPPSPPPSPPPLEVDVATVSSGLYNTTFAIPRATTIPADSTEHKVTVALVDLQPELHYTSVPRLSPHSFLQAKAKNTSPYTMLAGPANIFLDSNFIAKSVLSDVSPNEDFTCSLGADQAIRITCHPIAVVHGNTGLLIKSSLLTYTLSFDVKNTRPESVSLQVYEQVPLSTDDRIKVAVVEPDLRKQGAPAPLPSGHAVLNEDNNVEWHVGVAAGAELPLRLVYTVEHPLQDDVEGLPKS